MSDPQTSPNDDKPVVILGAGGHARVLISLLQLIGRPILAALDDNKDKHTHQLDGVTITGSLDDIDQFDPQSVCLVNAIGSAGPPTARAQVFDRFARKQGYNFATLIHPSAVIAPNVTIHEGAQVMASATIQPGVVLENNCLINTRAIIDHDTHIGAHTHVAPGVTICGGSIIKANCHIGAGATVIQRINIGEGSVVGAGATVIGDIAANQTVVGTPAKSK